MKAYTNPRMIPAPVQTVSNSPLIDDRVRNVNGSGYPKDMPHIETPLLRTEIGDVLRALRQEQGRTLREVSSQARVSLGYLSEVERGQKEASSELLESITTALGVPLWFVLRQVADRMAASYAAAVTAEAPASESVPVALLS